MPYTCYLAFKGFKFRLRPTKEQADVLKRWIGVGRFLYNKLVEEQDRRVSAWKEAGADSDGAAGERESLLTYQAKDPTRNPYKFCSSLRTTYTWLVDSGFPSAAQNGVCRCFGSAMRNYFENKKTGRLKRPEASGRFRFGWPTYKSKRDGGSIVFDSAVKVSGSALELPNLGAVEFVRHRRLRGSAKHAVVSYVAGFWYVSILCEWTAKQEPRHARPGSIVGVDRGVIALVGMSEPVPGDQSVLTGGNRSYRSLEARIGRAQQDVERKTSFPVFDEAGQPVLRLNGRQRYRDSNRKKKARLRVARLQHRAARVRKDVIEKLSTRIASAFETVVIEDLNVKAMTARAYGRGRSAKSGLNKAILDQGWGALRVALKSKTERFGGQLIEVPASYTSQTCPECGYVDAKNRKTQASFLCLQCGFADNADRVGALNVLARGLAQIAAGQAVTARGALGARGQAVKREGWTETSVGLST